MRSEIRPLTSLRFFAAVAIVFHHLAGVLWLPSGYFEPYPLESAVSFFFVLSGFILHYSYGSRFSEIGLPRFLISRFMRLWPVHIAVIILSAIWIQIPLIQFHLERQTLAEVFQIVFLFQAWNQKMIVFWGLNGPSWSISVEIFFYMMFPLLLLLLTRAGLVVFLTVVASATGLWLLIASLYLYSSEQEFSALALGYISPLSRIGEFCVGVALSHVLARRVDLLRQGARWRWTIYEGLALILLLGVTQNIGDFAAMFADYGSGPVVRQWVESSGAFPVFALVIFVFVVGRGMISSVLTFPVFVWLGKISFAMYLVHQPLIYHWTREVVPFQPFVTVQVIGYVVVLLIFSVLLYRYIEMPGVRLGKWMSDKVSRVRLSRVEGHRPIRPRPLFPHSESH